MHGYDWNDGGVNNQKFALLGLFVAALEENIAENRVVYLPKIYSRDQHHKEDSLHEFGDIFCLQPIVDFSERWGIRIAEAPSNITYSDRIERGGWRYFYRGTAALEALENDNINLSFPADFFRSIKPRIASSFFFQKLANQIFSKYKVEISAQLRIEEDWAHFSEYHIKPSAQLNEEYYASAERIISKVAKTLPKSSHPIFVSCDERYLFAPKWTIAEKVLETTGLKIIFKSDVVENEEFQKLRPIDASLLDFEMVKLSDYFVGLTRSTFANLAVFERCVMSYKDAKSNYVYNLPGELCGLRTDFGKEYDPIKACR